MVLEEERKIRLLVSVGGGNLFILNRFFSMCVWRIKNLGSNFELHYRVRL